MLVRMAISRSKLRVAYDVFSLASVILTKNHVSFEDRAFGCHPVVDVCVTPIKEQQSEEKILGISQGKADFEYR